MIDDQNNTHYLGKIDTGKWMYSIDINYSNWGADPEYRIYQFYCIDDTNKTSEKFIYKLYKDATTPQWHSDTTFSVDKNGSKTFVTDINITDNVFDHFSYENITDEAPLIFDINNSNFVIQDYNSTTKLFKLYYIGNTTGTYSIRIEATENKTFHPHSITQDINVTIN